MFRNQSTVLNFYFSLESCLVGKIIFVQIFHLQVLTVGNYNGRKVQDVKKEIQKEMIDRVCVDL